ncbi:MAG: DUF507 domain-containing protein [Geobacter sp.]|nr:MAG: DUF507 domain-containing protein [Geobacter sp.]
MRLKDEQIAKLADKILADLTTADLIRLKQERGAVLAGIKGAISADLSQEATLEKDAENLLEQTLRSMGSAAGDIDRHKMLRMIKEKLAKERKIVI